MWVVTRRLYGISALITQTSFCEGSSGILVKRRLFSQAIRTHDFFIKGLLCQGSTFYGLTNETEKSNNKQSVAVNQKALNQKGICLFMRNSHEKKDYPIT